MIQIENLSKVFRTSEVETIALNHVNIEVKEGEFVAIMGPSGCGKSTLLNILGLLDNPTEGSYKLLGNLFSTGLWIDDKNNGQPRYCISNSSQYTAAKVPSSAGS